MATGSDAPGAKPKSPMGRDDSATPINERVTASHDAAYRDAFEEEGEDVEISSRADKRPSEPIIDLRPSAEVVEIDVASDASEPSDAAPGFESSEPKAMRETDPDRPALGRPPPLPGPSDDPPDQQDRSFPPIAMSDPRIGETLNGRYHLEKLIGKGGMGRVYRAIQYPLNRPVALKILNPEFQKKDPQFVRRFYLEASTAARLSHPNTITVFDYGEAESGELFIVMECLKGRPLSRIITADGPFSFERTLHIAVQICRALREAHTKGIIHRDLKPGNIMLLEEGDDADFVKVLDFGLVKLFTPPKDKNAEPLTPGPMEEPEAGELTRAGMFLGSPKYMSPEQIQGMPLDPRTDIYSLGVLMFQMVAGKPPFGGSTSVEVIYKHVNHPVPRIREINPAAEVPDELEAVIRQCLEKNRDKRFPSMGELLVRLKDVRRLLTGTSGASELGVSLAELQEGAARVSVSHAAMTPLEKPLSASQSLSLSGSLSSSRPQTRPITGSQSVAGPRPAIPKHVAATPIQEAPFSDLGEDTPGPLSRRDTKVPRVSAMSKLAPIAAGAALVLVLGVGAYVFSSASHGGGEPSIDRDPAIAGDSRVAFASTPEGAQVFEDGKPLGITPFAKSFPIDESRARKFVFKLDGFGDEVIEEHIETSSVKIQAHMRALDKKKPDPDDKDYKDNPY